MSEVEEAYDVVMDAVQEMEASGIEVTVVTARSVNDPVIVRKYSAPERLPPGKWKHVTFHPKDRERVKVIEQIQEGLNHRGIRFDTGHSLGQKDLEVDWELDWSFHVYVNDAEIVDTEERRRKWEEWKAREDAGIRAAIRAVLKALETDLGSFLQTTHGCLGGGSIEDVADRLQMCWNDPNAFNVSELSQVIRAFLKREEKP